ncbi:MAG: hypothetical protein V4463_13405 [Pseudomonadota bacterium]
MKKWTCVILALLFPLFAQAEPPKAETLTVDRIWVKDGHMDAFKKAIAAHVKLYHTGNWKWRTYDVLSGPDGGALQINEGPNTWTDMEGRGDLSAAHTKHYDTAVLPHLAKYSPTLYMTYDDKLSTTALGNFSTKAVITRIIVKPGRGMAYTAALKTNKAVWEKLGRNVAVWRSFASGQQQVSVVTRLKQGFKDFDVDQGTYVAAYDSVNGAGSYEKYLEEMARDVDSATGEMIEYKPEMSSAQ